MENYCLPLVHLLPSFSCTSYDYFKGELSTKKKVARHRSSTAYKKLLNELKKMKTEGDITAFSSALGRRIHHFLEERFLCSLTHIDESTLSSLTNQGEMTKHTASQLLDIIERIDQQRYATHVEQQSNPPQLLNDTIEALQRCDL